MPAPGNTMIDRLNDALCSGGGVPLFDYDTAQALDRSHEWTRAGAWVECRRCAVREHWPAAREICAVQTTRHRVTVREAHEALIAELEAFFAWWEATGLDEALPDMHEWAANWFEWRRPHKADPHIPPAIWGAFGVAVSGDLVNGRDLGRVLGWPALTRKFRREWARKFVIDRDYRSIAGQLWVTPKGLIKILREAARDEERSHHVGAIVEALRT